MPDVHHILTKVWPFLFWLADGLLQYSRIPHEFRLQQGGNGKGSAQGGGLFINPVSTSAPAKLRLLYECAPLAFIVEAAGGASSNGMQSILELPVTSLDARTPICLGSPLEVQKTLPCFHAMQGVSGTLHSRIGV